MSFDARIAFNNHYQSCMECMSARLWKIPLCEEGQPLRDAADLELSDNTELWSLTSTGPVFGEVRGAQIFMTHKREVCEQDSFPCCLHSPSQHAMSGWPMLWRADRALMERTCPHGVGHPDPDDLAFHVRNGDGWQGVHGCDGCCSG